MGKFKVGDTVRWTTVTEDELGVVTHIIPAGACPSDVGIKIADKGLRDHESYVVRSQQVSCRDDKPKGRHMDRWPRVNLLVKVPS